jgi:hypothetical protein
MSAMNHKRIPLRHPCYANCSLDNRKAKKAPSYEYHLRDVRLVLEWDEKKAHAHAPRKEDLYECPYDDRTKRAQGSGEFPPRKEG